MDRPRPPQLILRKSHNLEHNFPSFFCENKNYFPFTRDQKKKCRSKINLNICASSQDFSRKMNLKYCEKKNWQEKYGREKILVGKFFCGKTFWWENILVDFFDRQALEYPKLDEGQQESLLTKFLFYAIKVFLRILVGPRHTLISVGNFFRKQHFRTNFS